MSDSHGFIEGCGFDDVLCVLVEGFVCDEHGDKHGFVKHGQCDAGHLGFGELVEVLRRHAQHLGSHFVVHHGLCKVWSVYLCTCVVLCLFHFVI